MARRRKQEQPEPKPEYGVVGEYTGDDHRGPRRVYTRQEVRAQKQLVEQMLVQGYAPRAIHAAIARARDATPLDGVSVQRIQKLARVIEDRWAKEDESERPKWKMRAIRRLQANIQRWSNGRQDATGKVIEKPNPMGVMRAEELLAKIQGTLAPLEVKVDVHVAMSVQHVIADMTAEDVQLALAEHTEDARLAREYRAMLAAGKVLTTPMGDEILPAREEQPVKRTG